MTYPNSLKTHCPKGHPYDERNTLVRKEKNGRYKRYCLTCKRELQRKNRARYDAKDRARRAERVLRDKAWSQRFPEKRRAHRRVYLAIQKGILIKPDHCSKCGATGRIEGSHDDYSKPLEVVWLCPRCHGERDVELGHRKKKRRASVSAKGAGE